jgi:hypothetical protein
VPDVTPLSFALDGQSDAVGSISAMSRPNADSAAVSATYAGCGSSRFPCLFPFCLISPFRLWQAARKEVAAERGKRQTIEQELSSYRASLPVIDFDRARTKSGRTHPEFPQLGVPEYLYLYLRNRPTVRGPDSVATHVSADMDVWWASSADAQALSQTFRGEAVWGEVDAGTLPTTTSITLAPNQHAEALLLAFRYANDDEWYVYSRDSRHRDSATGRDPDARLRKEGFNYISVTLAGVGVNERRWWFTFKVSADRLIPLEVTEEPNLIARSR